MDSQCYDTHCNASYIGIKVEVEPLYRIDKIAPKTRVLLNWTVVSMTKYSLVYTPQYTTYF